MIKKLKTYGGMLLLALLGFLWSKSPVLAQRTDTDVSPIVKVYVLSFNPILEAQGNQRLSLYKGWTTGSYNEINMANDLVNTIQNASANAMRYQVVGQQIVDGIPVKQDGFQYTDATYLNCLNNGVGCHTPDDSNMVSVLQNYGICTMKNSGQIDELWIFGAPYMGFQSFMAAGPTGMTTNRYISGTACNSALMISNFGYDTSFGSRLTNYHMRVVASQFNAWNKWLYGKTGYNTAEYLGKFMAYQGSNPTNAGCGFDHTTPNSTVENGVFNSTATYPSKCNDFLNFPYLEVVNPMVNINCSAWGCTEEGYVAWWMARLPRYKGRSLYGWDNWWKYVYAYDTAKNYSGLDNDPRGYVKSTGGLNCRVKGSVCDPNNYAKTLTVDFYKGTTKVGETVANINDSSLIYMCGNTINHSYDLTLTGLPAGTNRVYARVRDVDASGNETGTPYSLSVNPAVTNCW